MNFTKQLTIWYSKNKRDLPWRADRHPYRIWLSEIILQQTRIEQGKPYYERFVAKYPRVSDLASADEDDVLKLWQGLGYYSRARNLLKAARQVVRDHNGQFPSTYADLLSLKGVGPYTAAAIASISFGEPVALVDGNVFRFLGRHFGIATSIDTTAGKNEYHALASELMDIQHPGDYNQALMEFGATVCTPHNPDCFECPFVQSCTAFNQKAVGQFPVKAGKVKAKKLHMAFFAICAGGKTYLTQRPSNGIWGGLYEFPCITASEPITDDYLNRAAEKLGLPPTDVAEVSPVYNHVLTHRKISARFWLFELESFAPPADWLAVSIKTELQQLAVPRLIDRYLKSRIFPETNKIVT